MKNNFKEVFIFLLLTIILNFSTISSIPVLDRDEARYAQATKQMIETSNYGSIKFQEEYRNKKPIGIYWLQSSFVNLFSKKTRNNDKSFSIINNSIWKYRFVSSFFSFISILLIFFLSKKIFNKDVAFISSLTLLTTLLFTIEAHIAKTDAVLLTTVIISMLTINGFFNNSYKKGYNLYFFLLWITVGVSTLIKGPLLIIYIILSLTFFIALKKNIKWFYNTKPLEGLFIVLLITVPWFLSMSGEEKNNFLTESIVNDFFYKIIKSQENHSAFIGAHTIATWFLFFPMSIFLIPMILKIKKCIKDNNIFFQLSWILPNLFIIELIPTKLPHYALPIYPAISLLVGYTLVNLKNINTEFKKKYIFLNGIVYLSVGLGIIYLLYKSYNYLGNGSDLLLYITGLLILVLFVTLLFLYKGKPMLLFYYQIFISCIFTLLIFLFFLPNMNKLWISQEIYSTLKEDNPIYDASKVASIGYNEPSLIFQVGTKINILRNLDNFNEDFIKYSYIIVSDKYNKKYLNLLEDSNVESRLVKNFKGFNAAKGKKISLSIYKIN